MMEEKNYPLLGERVLREKLPNGLDFIVVPKPGFVKSYAFFASNFGSIDMKFKLGENWLETPAGIAHYLEHKMFDTEDGNALQELSMLGAEPNAFTGNAMTAYYFSSSENFERCLEILLSFVSIPYFTEESVAKEQGIIGQEIRMIEDNPDWQVYSNLLRGLYKNHPSRIPVAGTVESIAEITSDMLYKCHDAFYNPSNMALCIVGDVEPEKIRAIVEKALPTAGADKIERDYGEDEDGTAAESSIEIEMEVSMPQFMCGYKCPAVGEGEELLRNELIGTMAAEILFGESSPLYAQLYEKGIINASFGGGYDTLPGAAYLYVGGESKNPRRVHLAVADEAERLAREGIDEEFYQQIRRSGFGQLLRQLNSFEGIAVSMVQGGFHNLDYYRFPEIFETISKSDIEDFLRNNVIPDRATISIVHPKGV